MHTLHGKVAIVTGASSGIGRATALRFARAGASTVLVARRAAALQTLAAEIESAGGQACVVAGDVRDETIARQAVAVAESAFDGLDIAFNGAGILGAMGPTPSISLADWRHTLDTNLTSAFLAAKYQLPAMQRRGGGSLIFVSTFVGHTVGFPGLAAYAASKSGLIGLAQVLAAEFGPQAIRVNTLLPGGTDTPMAAEMNDSPEALAQVASLHALKRIAAPDEIAGAALFLASDAASFVTGSALRVEGGVSINRS